MTASPACSAGDDLLCQVATRLAAMTELRDDLARTAADDFVILMGHHEATAVEACARRMLETVRDPFTVAGQGIFLAASIGIASVGSTEGPQDPLHAAGIAMHPAEGRRSGPVRPVRRRHRGGDIAAATAGRGTAWCHGT